MTNINGTDVFCESLHGKTTLEMDIFEGSYFELIPRELTFIMVKNLDNFNINSIFIFMRAYDKLLDKCFNYVIDNQGVDKLPMEEILNGMMQFTSTVPKYFKSNNFEEVSLILKIYNTFQISNFILKEKALWKGLFANRLHRLLICDVKREAEIMFPCCEDYKKKTESLIRKYTEEYSKKINSSYSLSKIQNTLDNEYDYVKLYMFIKNTKFRELIDYIDYSQFITEITAKVTNRQINQQINQQINYVSPKFRVDTIWLGKLCNAIMNSSLVMILLKLCNICLENDECECHSCDTSRAFCLFLSKIKSTPLKSSDVNYLINTIKRKFSPKENLIILKNLI